MKPPSLFSAVRQHSQGRAVCLAFGLVCLLSHAPARADLITFRFTGTVTRLSDPLHIANGSLALDDPVSGYYTFPDTPSFVDLSQPNTADYVFFSDPQLRPFGTWMQAGQGTLDGISLFPVLNIGVRNDAPGPGDVYATFQQTRYPDAFLSPSDPSLSNTPPTYPFVGLDLYDPSGTALSSLALPLTPPDLPAFSSRTGFIQIFDSNSFDDLLLDVEFRVDSLHLVTPEPNAATLWLSTICCGGLLFLRRQRGKGW